MSDALAIAFPLKLLQAFRLAHAICETGLRVHVPESHASTFDHIAAAFGTRVEIGVIGVPPITDVGIDHERPVTRIADLERLLIFPHGMITHCREAWPDRRTIGVSFCGLITPSRRESLEAWIGGSLRPTDTRTHGDGRMHLAFRATSRRRLRGNTDIEVWWSRRGRTYPGKAWDEEYFSLLASSRFVLCPPGDFVWTYRFFEAILCGAIPVVEKACEAYEGFFYLSTDVDPTSLVYDVDAARANQERAIDLLTVPLDELRRAAIKAAT